MGFELYKELENAQNTLYPPEYQERATNQSVDQPSTWDNFPDWAEALKPLCKKMLQHDPATRPSATEACAFLGFLDRRDDTALLPVSVGAQLAMILKDHGAPMAVPALCSAFLQKFNVSVATAVHMRPLDFILQEEATFAMLDGRVALREWAPENKEAPRAKSPAARSKFLDSLTEDSVASQLSKLLSDQYLTVDELGLLYCNQHGVSPDQGRQALTTLGVPGGKLSTFLAWRKEFLVEGDNVALQREDTPGSVERDEAWTDPVPRLLEPEGPPTPRRQQPGVRLAAAPTETEGDPELC
jgi:hypothetical protein